MGFGNSEEVFTTINPVQTVYFRKAFTLQNAASVSYLAIILNYDNGAVVYLNGQEIKRLNLSYENIDYNTWALDGEKRIEAIALSSDQLKLLKEGMNVIAVEIHQAQQDSADMFFDVRIIDPDPVVEFGEEWNYFDAGYCPEVQIQEKISGVNKHSGNEMPDRFQLYQNYPNPFNSSTVIRYHLGKTETVNLAIYDVQGKLVKTLVNDRQKTGIYSSVWDGKNKAGNEVSSGIYLCRLAISNSFKTRKIVYVR